MPNDDTTWFTLDLDEASSQEPFKKKAFDRVEEEKEEDLNENEGFEVELEQEENEESSSEEKTKNGEENQEDSKDKKGRAQKRIRDLNEKFRKEEQRRLRLEKELEEERKRNKETLKQTITNQKISLKNEIEAQKRARKAARDEGDYAAEEAADEALSEARVRLMAIESSYSEEDFEYKPQKKEEASSSGHGVDRAEEWLEDNPEFFSNEGFKSAVLFYSNKLTKQGIDPADDEYYEKLDEFLVDKGFKKKASEEEEEKFSERKGKNSTPPGGRTTGRKGGSGKVQLSRSEQEMADRLGLSYKDYALQKKKLEKKNINGYTSVFDK